MQPSPTSAHSTRIGVDIGGTFTDVVLINSSGGMLSRKILSSIEDYGRAIRDVIGEVVVDAHLDTDTIHDVVHGTTICTNAILESKGARTGLLTTRGFRDTLELGRMRYPKLYDLTWRKPPPLVPRRLRFEVAERVGADGQVVEPLNANSARTVVKRLLAAGVESVAISLINSYANSQHELELRRLVAQVAPEIPVSVSSEVLPEIGEYERTSTTVINAYLQPVVGRYLAQLGESLASIQVRSPIWVMQSNGGVMSSTAAAERPIHIVESGPAAGVIASLELAKRLDMRNVITLDMGGTTAKTSIIENGQLHRAAEYEVGAGINVGNRLNSGAGYRLRVPAIDIAEVGSGGGSLVVVDAAGALHVGPESAGASPGPVCYGMGGDQPTLTDANLVLGYLNQDALLGGKLRLDAERARQVLGDRVARPLGLDLLTAAYGVHRIGVANMVRAVRAISSERGRDPRAFTLLAYGGNGPLHAVAAAEEMGIAQLVVPPSPGVFSAFGLLSAEPSYHLSRSVLQRIGDVADRDLERVYCELESAARDVLAREGYDPGSLQVRRFADLRYAGQSFELRVPLNPRGVTPESLAEIGECFEAEHERTYGHRATGDPIELVHARIEARHPVATPAFAAATESAAMRRPTGEVRRRETYFGPRIGLVESSVVGRSDIDMTPTRGPIIVEEYDATTLVPPGSSIWRDELDNLLIQVGSP